MLAGAVAAAERIAPVFVLDDAILRSAHHRPNRAQFLSEALRDLDASPRDRGGRLVVRRGDWAREVAGLAADVGAVAVHVAGDVTGYSRSRLDRLRAALAPGVRLDVHDDALLVAPPVSSRAAPGTTWRCSRRTSAGGSSARCATPRRRRRAPCACRQSAPATFRGAPTSSADSRRPTSRGVIEVVRRARQRGGPGPDAFVRQIAWRDFHHQVLAARPAATREDYRPRGDRWRDSEEELTAAPIPDSTTFTRLETAIAGVDACLRGHPPCERGRIPGG